MRGTFVAMSALSAAFLYAGGASPQVSVSPIRVSADRLPTAGDDTASYWGIGGGAASAASGGIERGAAKPEEKPHVNDARK